MRVGSRPERSARATVRGETLGDYAKRWIAARNIKPRTRLLYVDLLEKHIAPSLGDIGIGALPTDTVNHWYAKTLTDKPTTRAHAYGLLHAICASAVEDELIARNPLSDQTGDEHESQTRTGVTSVSELAAVADAIRPERFRALVLLSGAHCVSVRPASYAGKTSGKAAKQSLFRVR